MSADNRPLICCASVLFSRGRFAHNSADPASPAHPSALDQPPLPAVQQPERGRPAQVRYPVKRCEALRCRRSPGCCFSVRVQPYSYLFCHPDLCIYNEAVICTYSYSRTRTRTSTYEYVLTRLWQVAEPASARRLASALPCGAAGGSEWQMRFH